MSKTFSEMINAVKYIHEALNLKEKENPYFRLALLMEEVGELAEIIIKKGIEKNSLEEELADILILTIGNAIAWDIDLEKAFWEKLEKVKKKGVKLPDNSREHLP